MQTNYDITNYFIFIYPFESGKRGKNSPQAGEFP